MRILFVSPYVPNQIRVRPYNWIRNLAMRGHQITLLTVCSSDEDRRELANLEKYCELIKPINLPSWRSLINCLRALPSKEPLQAAYSWDAKLAEDLYQLATCTNGTGNFDVIHIEHLRGARYGVDLIRRCVVNHARLPIVWDSVDSISLLFRQAMVQSKRYLSREITRLELGRTEKYEAFLVGKFDRVLVTSQNDKQAILSICPNEIEDSKVVVLPNGVDSGFFTPGDNGSREKQTIVLSGKMSYHANESMVIEFMEEIMPHVWSRYPEARVWIAGKDPSTKIRTYAQHPKVTVTGTVADMRPYLKMASISASPVHYGVGIQNKVLEAMACETPVIATRQAVSALSIEEGQEIIIADGPLDFAEKISSLLADPVRRELIGKAGRRFVENNHDWATSAAHLEEIYTQVIKQRYPADQRESVFRSEQVS